MKCLKKEKAKKSCKKWRAKNKEYTKEYDRKYYIKNKKKKRENEKKYNSRNKERLRKYKKKYRENLKNKNIAQEYQKKYQIKNKERLKKYVSYWAKTDKGKIICKKINHKRNALLKNSLFDLTKKDIEKIFKRDVVCVYCNSFNKLSLDHIIPVSNGGDTTFNNIVLACKSCNSSKNNKDVFKWCKSKKIIVPKIVISLMKNQRVVTNINYKFLINQ